ncbi:MAG: hypothetical protein ACI4Q3_04520 [Kiritimatiellia bacterium]
MTTGRQSVSGAVEAGRRALSALLAAIVLALGLFRGTELCLCAHEASAGHGHAHCRPCDYSCGADGALSPADDAGLVADACAHLVVDAADLYLGPQPDSSLCVPCGPAFRDVADAVVPTRRTALLPPSTAPPGRGDRFLSYRNRLFLRS